MQEPFHRQLASCGRTAEVGIIDRSFGFLAAADGAAGRRVIGDEIRCVQLLELHPHAQRIVAEVLLLVVDAVIAVEFIDDVMELCEHKAADVLVQAVFVEHIVVLPGQVAVAGAVLHAPDHTALGVHQRHVRRTVFPDEVPAAALMPALGGGIDVLLDGHIAVQIEVPGVDIRLHMIIVAGGVSSTMRVSSIPLDAAGTCCAPIPAYRANTASYAHRFALSNRPQVSLNTIQAMMDGWFQSRRTNSSSSCSNCARVSGSGSPQ